jgi:haloalkane dehalogenase
MIDPADEYQRHLTQVLGWRMAYVDEGRGRTVIFIHGNATHSYFWRNALGYVATKSRSIAIDLPGMGASEPFRPSGRNSYQIPDLVTQVWSMIDSLRLPSPWVLVGHELGALIAADIARARPFETAGLVLIDPAIDAADTTSWDPEVVKIVELIRSDDGEREMLMENVIIERYLPSLVNRRLSPYEMERYRRPYVEGGEKSRPLISLMRALPIEGDPGPIKETVDAARAWCRATSVPKLIMTGDPGFLVSPHRAAAWKRWKATTVEVVPGSHFLMEDSPDRITASIRSWLETI